jgi:putative ABC transport system ATP-binding protein
MELLKELNKREGITEVIVTHDPGVAEKTNRIIRIADGVIS